MAKTDDKLDEFCRAVDAGYLDLANPQNTIDLQLALGPDLAEKCVRLAEAIKEVYDA
jgi:hypothetical protein